MPKDVLEFVLEFVLESEYQTLELLDFTPIIACSISDNSKFRRKTELLHYVHGQMSHGIQEVSGSIPLISTVSPENNWFSGLFLAIIAKNRYIIRIFRTGALHPGPRYSPYRNYNGSRWSNTSKSGSFPPEKAQENFSIAANFTGS